MELVVATNIESIILSYTSMNDVNPNHVFKKFSHLYYLHIVKHAQIL